MRAGAVLCLSLVLAGGPSHAGVARCWYENGALVAPAAFGDIAGDFIVDVSAPTSQLHLTRAEGEGIVTPSIRAPLRLAGRRLGPAEFQVANLNARIRQQHAGSGLRRARHRRIVAHQILSDRAVDEKGELGRQIVRIGDAERACRRRAGVV